MLQGIGSVLEGALSSHINSLKAPGALRDRLSDDVRQSTKHERLSAVVELGNGVYVFPRDAYFAETLSDFIGEYSNLKLVALSQGPDTSSGVLDQTDSRANSMIVVFEPKYA